MQSRVQASALPAAVSFLTGGSALSAELAVALDRSGKLGGKGTIVLELTPHQPSARYKQLFFVVDPADWRVIESVVIDFNGDTNDFRFYTPSRAAAVSPSLFRVNPSALPAYKLVQPNQPAPATAHAPRP